MRRWLALPLLSIFLLGCASAPRGSDKPAILRFAYNPTADDIQASNKRYQGLKDYLSKAMKMPVDLVQATGYSATIEAMRANRVDVATMGPLSYLIAVQKAGAEALAVPGNTQGPLTYRSCIIVKADSPIKTLEELIQGSKKYTMAFVDPASTSGHLIPRVFLEGRGLDVEKSFRKMFFSTSHPLSLYPVTGGKVDAAATMPSMIHTMEENGKLKTGEVRILWESVDIPASPVAVRKSLPEAFKKELLAAFVGLAKADPELAAALQVTTKHKDFQYYPATDAMYDGLRAIAKDLKNVKILE
jgi:phosphonate transport system substrate-binding protein